MKERRFSKGAEVRAKGDDQKPALEGYAAVFGEDYVLYESKSFRMIERIKAGAFTRAIEEDQDVRCLFNHQPDHLLARTANGTLKLNQDKKGLQYDADLDSRTHIAQDVRCFVDRKDVTGCSFAFMVRKQTWTETENDGFTLYLREIEDVDLFDVGPVTYPAYDGTSVGARSHSLAHELRSAAWAEGIPAEIRAKLDARAGKDEDDMGECNCKCSNCKNCENRSANPKRRGAVGSDNECQCTCAECQTGDCQNCSVTDCDAEGCDHSGDDRAALLADVDARMRRAGMKVIATT